MTWLSRDSKKRDYTQKKIRLDYTNRIIANEQIGYAMTNNKRSRV